MTTNKYSDDDINAAINIAARRMMDTAEPQELRARVMARVAVAERRSFGWSWRLAMAGGGIGAAVIMTVALWPSSTGRSTIASPVLNTAQTNPAVAAPVLATHPTDSTIGASPVVSTMATRRARTSKAITVSAAEMEWRERAVTALEAIDPLHVEPLTHESIGIESIDIAPLVVAPLTVTAIR